MTRNVVTIHFDKTALAIIPEGLKREDIVSNNVYEMLFPSSEKLKLFGRIPVE